VGFEPAQDILGNQIAMGAYSVAESALIGHYSFCNDPAPISFFFFFLGCNLSTLPSVVVFFSSLFVCGGHFEKSQIYIKTQ
jgi:hypothetical protein